MKTGTITADQLDYINRVQAFVESETDTFIEEKVIILLALASRYMNKEGFNKKEACTLLREIMSNGACSEQYVKG